MPGSGKNIVTLQSFIASAAAISEPMKPPPMTAKLFPSAAKVVERAIIDDVVAAEGEPTRCSAGGQQQLLEVVFGAAIVGR